jgi:hypothetical protein
MKFLLMIAMFTVVTAFLSLISLGNQTGYSTYSAGQDRVSFQQ